MRKDHEAQTASQRGVNLPAPLCQRVVAAIETANREALAMLLAELDPRDGPFECDGINCPLLAANHLVDPDLLEALIEHRILPTCEHSSVSTWDTIVSTAVHLSNRPVAVRIVRLINPDYADTRGFSPLMKAAYFRSDLLAALLPRARHLDRSCDKQGWTALMYAAACNEDYGWQDALVRIELLLQAGANASARDPAGRTPAAIARSQPTWGWYGELLSRRLEMAEQSPSP